MRRNQVTPQPIQRQTSLSNSSRIGQTSLAKNQTLSGLVQHIQSPLNQVIKLKQSSKYRLDEKEESEQQKLIKIQQEVANLKFIIHQYDAQNQKYLSLSIPKHDKKQNSAKTNNSLSPQLTKSSVFQLNSIKITDFERQVIKKRTSQISQNHSNKQNISNFINIMPQSYNSKKQNNQQVCQVIGMRKNQKTQPLGQIQLTQSPEQVKLQHLIAVQDDSLNCGFHAATQEDQLHENPTKHLQYDKILKDIQSIQFKTPQNQIIQSQIPNITFFPAHLAPQNQKITDQPKSKKARSDHFYFGHQQPVLPSRHPRRKYNYLQLANQN